MVGNLDVMMAAQKVDWTALRKAVVKVEMKDVWSAVLMVDWMVVSMAGQSVGRLESQRVDSMDVYSAAMWVELMGEMKAAMTAEQMAAL